MKDEAKQSCPDYDEDCETMDLEEIDACWRFCHATGQFCEMMRKVPATFTLLERGLSVSDGVYDLSLAMSGELQRRLLAAEVSDGEG